jgi:hypothetical protein|tara:strand:- start:305 stop:466 length:162 start_codon:yes stop_codon:yes gene_type:complete
MKDEIMSKEKEKCPTCVNDLILEIRIVDMGLFQHQYEYVECITCTKQWTREKE